MMRNQEINKVCSNCGHFSPDGSWPYGTRGKCMNEQCPLQNITGGAACEFWEKRKERYERTREKDLVFHPGHYCEGRKYEPIKVIQDWGLNFALGSAVKYIARAGRKDDAIQDLEKAMQYIEFEIERLENENNHA